MPQILIQKFIMKKSKNLLAVAAMSLLLTACGSASQNNYAENNSSKDSTCAQQTVAQKPSLKRADDAKALKMLNEIWKEIAGTAENTLNVKEFTQADFNQDGVFSKDLLYEDSEIMLHLVDKFWAVEKADGSILGFFFKEGEEKDLVSNEGQDEIFIAFAYEYQDGVLVEASGKYIPNEQTIVPYTKIKEDLILKVNTNHYGFGKIRCAVQATDDSSDCIYFAWNGEKFVVSEP